MRATAPDHRSPRRRGRIAQIAPCSGRRRRGAAPVRCDRVRRRGPHDGGPCAVPGSYPQRHVDGAQGRASATTARRSRASCGSGRGQREDALRHARSTCRRARARTTRSTPSRRRSAAASRSPWSAATRRSRRARSQFALHDQSQLFVGVVAEEPGGSSASSTCSRRPPARLPSSPGSSVADLPDRVEAWASLDRLIWQDVDSTTLTTAQVAALRGWIAARRPAGRSSAGRPGPDALSALPRRAPALSPDRAVDVATRDARDAARLAAQGRHRRPGARRRARPRPVARDVRRPRRSPPRRRTAAGSVTIVGLRPERPTGSPTRSDASTPLWRRLLPARAGDDDRAERRQSDRRRDLGTCRPRPAAHRRPRSRCCSATSR